MATDLAIFLATSGHSSSDRLANNLAPALARRGYTIDLLKIRDHGPHLDRLPSGVRVVDLGTRHVYSSLLKLAHYLRRTQPVSMFCDGDRLNHTALLARALAGVSTQLTLSLGTTVSVDLAYRGLAQRLKTRLSIGWLYPLADNVIVTSNAAAEDATLRTGLRRNLIEAVPRPVVPASVFEDEFVRPDHPWFKDGGPPIIMGLGELLSRKDFVTLIRAFARLLPQYPSRLMILGRGRDRERLRATAHELGVGEAVEFPGFVTTPYPWLAQASLFVATPLWDVLGYALIEALAVGVPSVATDCPSGPREILDQGRYGPLVPVGDHEALASAMLATLRKPLPKATLQEAARPYEIESATTAFVRALKLPAPAPRH